MICHGLNLLREVQFLIIAQRNRVCDLEIPVPDRSGENLIRKAFRGGRRG